jgi:hypothetical protein
LPGPINPKSGPPTAAPGEPRSPHAMAKMTIADASIRGAPTIFVDGLL